MSTMTLDAKTIQKYAKHGVPALRKLATTHFNAYIRRRDEGLRCISCGKQPMSQAGHYYSAGHYPALSFNENNVHGQCLPCNYYLSGNLIEYRKNLIKKIGAACVEELDMLSRQRGFKWNRFDLILTIEKYKNK